MNSSLPRRFVDTREQLLHLLAEAAELEHNLLCCYLYAAFSLKRDASGLAPDEAAAVARWRSVIMSVAIEEMSHLALVANLTVAIGGRPHFNRPNFPVASGYHPADIVVELAPLDQATLDHFIFLERPEEAALADGEGFEPDGDYGRGGRRGAALMPGAYDYRTVAEFYQRLRGSLSALARDLGESALFVGNPSMQIDADIAPMPGIAPVTDLASALAAIDTIVVQGEGASGQGDDSHYARFGSIKDEYETLLRKRPEFAPAWPAARNPVMRRPVAPENRVHVDEPQAAALLDLANALYNHMLRLLGQAFGRGYSGSDSRRMLIDAAIRTMAAMGDVSVHLATLPASPTAPGVNAGITFTMLRATEALAEGRERILLGERFRELARGMRAVCADIPHLQARADELNRLADEFANPAAAHPDPSI